MNRVTLWTVQEPKFALDGTMNCPMQFRSIEAFETGMFGNLGAILPNGYIMTFSPTDNTRQVYMSRHLTDEPRRPEVFYCPTKRGAIIEYSTRLFERIRAQQKATELLLHNKIYLEKLRVDFEDEEQLARDCRIDAMHRSMSHD